MQLGFVIDHTRCIGCHACTVACKSENDVPLGKFRTWVKYTEQGQFPEVRRSFAVLRCNQCTQAPCVSVCPVRALEKRPDGIVDVDPERCIGCKSCMQACPYDALYLDESHGTVEKCHFCAHRTERGLAPACAVICPTEAIIPGDFHDPDSLVSRMCASESLSARKTEAGTGPNVWYRDVAPAGIEPQSTGGSGGYLWANRLPGSRLDAETFEALEQRAEARTVYDVEHPAMWGRKITAYLFTKSIAAGSLLAALPFLPPFDLGGGLGRNAALAASSGALLMLALTMVLLISDLKRPGRFLFILRYPNWSSWLTRGSFLLGGFAAIAAIWWAAASASVIPDGLVAWLLAAATLLIAALTAGYTAWLFRQSWGRVLWMRRGLALELILHAWIAGCAFLLLLAPWIDISGGVLRGLRLSMACALVIQVGFFLFEGRLGPRGRKAEYERVHRLLTAGPYAGWNWAVARIAGTAFPLLLLVASGAPMALAAAALLAWLGLWVQQDLLVRAGQALPIS